MADAPGIDEARALRLQRSVVRPLAAISGRGPDASVSESVADAESLWRLALDATRLRLEPGAPLELQEATAALQDLAVEAASAESDELAAARLAELRGVQGDLPTEIRCARNGPYLVTNAPSLVDWLGQEIGTRPEMALCRCGQSAVKPFCDGSHVDVGFRDAKDPKRVPDRRDSYVGEQVTVLDNRGICQHAGFCSDRLATVFRVDQEPFVAPSGGRMDEIIRAVRDCPSGALSFAIDGREAREQVDHNGQREASIEVSKDGPYRVTGGIRLLDADGADESRGDGASREHFALCRCGHSQNKPFCSGMHWYAEFEDPPAGADGDRTVFEWAGGLPALTRMTRRFYGTHVPEDPLLAPLFGEMSPDHPERVATWLAEVFCGPKHYSTRYGGYTRMISQHLGRRITEEQRERWVELLVRCADEVGLPRDPEFRAAFSSYIEWGTRLAVENSQAGARPPEHMPMPHWDWNTAAGPPGSRVSALAQDPAPDPVVDLPGADEPISFEQHIRALFRERDRQSMRFAFDLWSYDDVKANASAILERVRDGTMPCDGAWPQERIDAFSRWVDEGTPR